LSEQKRLGQHVALKKGHNAKFVHPLW